MAQNLIPNAGFEEVLIDEDFQWVQPQGDYYHYEDASKHSYHQAYSGRYINGLCMYNSQPNEYLHVRLLQRLVKGHRYRFACWARLYPAKNYNASVQQFIGVHFGNQRLDTQVPGDFFLEPQLQLSLPDSGRLNWFQLSDTLTAAGGEAYLTLGYFTDTQELELKLAAEKKRQEEWLLRHSAPENQVSTDDKAWLYLPPKQQKAYLNAKKKKSRKNAKREPEAAHVAGPYSTTSSAPAQPWPYAQPQFFAVRYYFDDFVLTDLNHSSDTSLAAPEILQVGSAITLRNVFFDSDAATLRPESAVQLQGLLRVLQQYPQMRIRISGHTDNAGNDAYNEDLSYRRATAVKQWLIEQGVSGQRLAVAGVGEREPEASNATEAGRALNRRVVIDILQM